MNGLPSADAQPIAGDAQPVPADSHAVDDGYRLISIERAAAPSGSAGREWLKYRIVQGVNVITGYRRGDLEKVTADVEKIVTGLNERRMVRRGRVDLRPSRPAASPATADSDAAE